VVAGPGEAPRAADWRLAYAGADARVYERPAALPLLRWAPPAPAASVGSAVIADAARVAPAAFLPAGLTVMRREPGRWEIGWHSAEPRLLVVAESWAPGWRALVDGQPRPVEAAAGALLGVRLGPGAGRAELRYRPPGLLAGAWISAAALLVLVALAAAQVRGRPPAGSAGPAGTGGAA
jgi:hypothetical protein